MLLASSRGSGKADPEGDALSDLLKRAQGSLPVIGLLSRLFSPDETFGDDVVAYQTYCRKLFDENEREWSVALYDFEERHGKSHASVKNTQFCCWMAAIGVGIVPKKDIITSARRLRYSSDLEYEIGWITGMVVETRQKYKYISADSKKVSTPVKLAVALEAVCECCLGLKQGQTIQPEDESLLRVILCGAFPDCPEEKLDEILKKQAMPIENKQ